MNIHGSCLAFPFQPDQRGMLRTVSDPLEMGLQFLADLIETRLMERVMLPGYGMPDRIFSVMNAAFTVQLAAELEEQVQDYLPIIESIKVVVGEWFFGTTFVPGFPLEQQRAALSVTLTVRGSNTPLNFVYPTWQLRSSLSG
jgi:phage baseplate assembly protein W